MMGLQILSCSVNTVSWLRSEQRKNSIRGTSKGFLIESVQPAMASPNFYLIYTVGQFPRGQSSGDMILATRPYPALRLRMTGAVYSVHLPNLRTGIFNFYCGARAFGYDSVWYLSKI